MRGEKISPCPRPLPAVLDRAAKRSAKALTQRQVYRLVDKRDGNRCRACEQLTSPTSVLADNRRHHHHLTFRSRGGATTTANVLILCGHCHSELHAHLLAIVGTNANKELKFIRRSDR